MKIIVKSHKRRKKGGLRKVVLVKEYCRKKGHRKTTVELNEKDLQQESCKCWVCGESLKKPVEAREIGLCEKKECHKMFVKAFSDLCQNVDELAEIDDTNGFYYNKHLIRYNHFDEDFDKAWEGGNKNR